MRRIAWAALLLLALSTGAIQAQESPAARHESSWAANVWTALADLMSAIFASAPEPQSPPNIMGGDCGAYIDPTGGCRG
jgi:hypothetical protein